MPKTDYWKYQNGCKHLITHGMSKTPTYISWSSMLTRCNNPNAKKYSIYGARGIKVCERWNTFQYFLDDMGEKPAGMSIDRIDNEGNYTPNNCRWATQRQQQNNRSNNMVMTFNGQSLTVAQWARRTGIPYFTLRYRFIKGWDAERALTEPVIIGKNQFS